MVRPLALAVPCSLVALLLAQNPSAPAGPGECSEEEFLQWQTEVVRWCPLPEPWCTAHTSCTSAMTRSRELYACHRAKWHLQFQCFKGGNDEQKKELEALRAEQKRCDDAIERRTCGRVDEDGESTNGAEPQKREQPPVVLSLAPPGDCTRELYRRLNSAVGEACKKEPMSCEDDRLDCKTLDLYIGRFDACIQARRILMETCFRGGDDDHRRVLNDVLRGKEKCLKRWAQRCGPDPRCSFCGGKAR